MRQLKNAGTPIFGDRSDRRVEGTQLIDKKYMNISL